MNSNNQSKIYIAGAHSRSRTLRVYLEYLKADLKVSAFLVSPEMTDNRETVDGIPVFSIAKDGLDTSCPVYLGTRGVNHAKLTKELSEAGFTDIRPATVELDSELRNEYIKKRYAEAGRKFVRLDMLSEECDALDTTFAIYVATSKKSNASYLAIDKALEDVKTKDTGEVPMHIRNAPVKQMES